LTGNGNGAARGAGPTLPRGCPVRLSEHYDAALLDLDGVVYLGGSPIPGAADALAEAAKQGMRLAYVTNNASRTPHAIAAQLVAMGIPATAADIVTSAQAAAHLVADRFPAGSPVLVSGGMGLRLALRERGLRPVSTAADRPVAVIQGYAHDLSYGLLAEAALAIRAGAWFVASNADATMPSTRGQQPGNGSLVQLLVTATGQQPVVAGKPQPPLHAESVERVGARRPLVVGDRLDTDIEGAVNGGADSLLVLTGVSRPADVLLAPRRRRPTYLAGHLTGLNASHPEVTRTAAGFVCGGWTAAPAADGAGWLTLSGSGDQVDGLRALCAAAWAFDDAEAGARPPVRSDAEALVRQLGFAVVAGAVVAGAVVAGAVVAGAVVAGAVVAGAVVAGTVIPAAAFPAHPGHPLG
jgi:glycerol-1-phosphatase